MRFVDEYRHGRRITRREWLRVGAGAACMPLLGQGIAAATASSPSGNGRPAGFGRAKSVIFVFASGGQSQIDTWDPKPDAPQDVRGEFAPISTAVPGVAFCEYLPRIAGLADRLTVIRNLSHEDRDHGSAAYLTLTGRYHARRSGNPDPSPDDLPTYGAVVQRLRSRRQFVYDAVHVNGPAVVPVKPAPGQYAGLLGTPHSPLVIGNVAANPRALPGMEPHDDVPTVRLRRRLGLKEALDGLQADLATRPALLQQHDHYRQAMELLASPACRDALSLDREPESLRDRYGRHRSGQACLMARRLVEVGVPWITVIWNHSNRGQDLHPDDPAAYGWDTHNDIFYALRTHLLPRFDQSFSALLEDLDARGLLEETLVVCMGEFGRAPQVALERRFAGSSPGRKHWPDVYSAVVAGAGVGRGAVVGASDRLGAEPVGDRYGPWDMAATMFSALGIPHDSHYRDPLDRPFPVTVGTPIEALYSG